MIGDAKDMLARFKAVLPARWFADDSPVLDAMLVGLAKGWTWSYGLLDYVRAQTRIATATDVWLDIIAQDFFGTRIHRRQSEIDDVLRRRIKHELIRDRCTRAAVISVLTDLTGREPRVFEPARSTDTGGYGGGNSGGGLGFGITGSWGSLALPFQCFVTAFRPHGNGIAFVGGWANAGTPSGAGGYGLGALEYASLAMAQQQVSDTDIAQAIASVMPVSTIAWTSIRD